MKYKLIRPCEKCPFRTDSLKGWLGEDRAADIAYGIIDQQGTFSCHETNDYEDEDGEVIENGDSQHCAGALIMLEKLQKPNQMMRIAEQLGFYDRHKLDMKAKVFDCKGDFIKHHTSKTRKLK